MRQCWDKQLNILSPNYFYKKIEKVEKKLSQIVGNRGFNQNMAYEICQGPSELGEIGFVPIKALVGSGYVLYLLKH